MSSIEPRHTLFVTTRWTLIREAAGGGDSEAIEALGTLFGNYWQPLYRYARRKGRSKEDAEDLVQGYFAQLMTADALKDVDQNKGKFRAFLLTGLNHWMINDWKRSTRQKRGGGTPLLSFDWESAENGLEIDAPEAGNPDKLFDREWALTLLGQVLDKLGKLSREEGNAAQFATLKPCLTSDSSRIPYAKIATQLGMTEGAARVAVHRLRKRYRHLLTEEIERTLSSPENIAEEMQSLFAALAG
ncbi:MAG: RNA polymerase sigma factor [Limisphaerales bacterium]